MNQRGMLLMAGLTVTALCWPVLRAQESKKTAAPEMHIYSTVDGVNLKAYVFRPDAGSASAARKPAGPRAAVVIFHGGGWYMGEPEWVFPRAQNLAKLGVIAVAAQYRLSDQKKVTPLEAMADARAVIRWMRANAAKLGIDPKRIAAYGSSAGGHLAVSAVLFDDAPPGAKVSAAPNALVLVSPAVDLENDAWPQRLLGARASVASISPAAHVRKGMPPTLILQGDVDTVTPLAGARWFCDRMQAAGNRCELHVYTGFGHVFTPAGTRDDGMPQPDAKISADASRKVDEFLVSLGFGKRPKN